MHGLAPRSPNPSLGGGAFLICCTLLCFRVEVHTLYLIHVSGGVLCRTCNGPKGVPGVQQVAILFVDLHIMQISYAVGGGLTSRVCCSRF